MTLRFRKYSPCAQPRVELQPLFVSPTRATMTTPTCADFVKFGGGTPQLVGCAALQEQRPSPPRERAPSIAAMIFWLMSPFLARKAASAANTTSSPVRTLPWIE